MGSRTRSIGTHEIDFLKDTLHAQQELLQKLYNELDAERESSAIAADETLSMILRLQGEKAAMELETSQYKRIVEEKMCHVEETLEFFQELIYQKDMQIASLEFQVQSYKYKLASMGCEYLVSSENMMSRRNSAQGTNGMLRRGNSLPPPVNIVLSRRASTEGARTSAPSPKILMENGVEPALKRVSSSQGDYNSYWEEIKKLDQRVKGFTGFPRLDCEDDVSVETVVKFEICGESQCSTSVQDIFEVPECSDKEETLQLSFDRETLNEKLDTVCHDQEKKPLLNPDSDFYSPNIKDIEERFDGNTEKQKAFKHSRYDFQLQELNRRLKQLETERFAAKDYENNFETGDDELKTLMEITEKVKALQSELTSLRTKKPPPPPEDRSFGCFKEVLFCFLPSNLMRHS